MKTILGQSLTLILLATGCATSSLRITSVPEGADVTMVQSDGNEIKVGKTPLTLSSETVAGVLSEPMQFRFAKEGYLPQSAISPAFGALGGSGQIQMNLSQTELPKICNDQSRRLETLAKGIAESSAMIQKKNFETAEQRLQMLTNDFPTVAVIFDLQGNVFFLQKKFDQALSAYRKSYSLNPTNAQTQAVIDRLQRLRGEQGVER